jgi:hypothetical protein
MVAVAVAVEAHRESLTVTVTGFINLRRVVAALAAARLVAWAEPLAPRDRALIPRRWRDNRLAAPPAALAALAV